MHTDLPTAHILLTGATGHVGSAVLAELLSDPHVEVSCLVRCTSAAEGRRRVAAALSTWLDAAAMERSAGRWRAVAGDISAARLGLDASEEADLLDRVTHIAHCAASVRFDETLEAARAVNVEGARAIIGFAEQAHARGTLARLTMVSTAFVSGTMARRFSEHELDLGQGFRTTYERSKFEAELLARQAMERLPITVVRPSIVVGHSQSGRTAAFNVLYAPLRLLLRAGTDVTLPVRADLPMDVVAVDVVARVIVEALVGGEDGTTYAAAAGCDALTMQDLVAVTAQTFGVEMPRLLPAAISDHVVSEAMQAWRGLLSPRARTVLDVYEPYLLLAAEFDNWRGTHLLWRAGCPPVDPAEVLRRSLVYARATDFGRRLRESARRRAVA